MSFSAPPRAPALAGRLRFATRALAATTATAGYLAALELETRLRRDDAMALVHGWVPRWASALLAIFGAALRVEGHASPYPGRSDAGLGRLFVMNHRSAMDILVVLATTEAHLVSRHDLAAWPGIGVGARRIGTMFVDRASMRSGATVLKEMTRALRAGRGVGIFPEGTAYPGDEVRPFRPGAFKAAIRTGAEVVPMGIAYADAAAYYGDETFSKHLERVASLPQLRAAVVFGEPLAPDGKRLVDLRDEARAAVQALVGRARSLL
jgi:lyso-ornithine lipid O-acyltransferase